MSRDTSNDNHCSLSRVKSCIMDVEEVKIPVPWGHLAALLWGDKRNRAVLMFHGLMDNAGSFEALIPLLPTSFCYIAVDLPGHGLSSHFPPHLPIHSTDNVIAYRLVAEHFQRKNYIIIGHSYGGQLGLLFAQMYPNYVSKLILLDVIYLRTVSPENFLSGILNSHEALLKIHFQENEKQPVYTYEGALNKLLNNRWHGKLTKKSAENILRRTFERVGEDEYVLRIDRRLKYFTRLGCTFEYIIGTFEKWSGEVQVLIILGSKSEIQSLFPKLLLDHYKRLGFNIQFVDGNHDVHTNNPEMVAPLVTNFLTDNSKL